MTLVETVTKVISEDKKNFKSHSVMDGQVAYKKQQKKILQQCIDQTVCQIEH